MPPNKYKYKIHSHHNDIKTEKADPFAMIIDLGKGKGSPEQWVAPIKPGRILYELTGVDEELAVKALTLAGNKLPFATKVISRRTTL